MRTGYSCANRSYGCAADVEPIKGLQTSKPLQNICQSSHRYLKVRTMATEMSGKVSMGLLLFQHLLCFLSLFLDLSSSPGNGKELQRKSQ